MHARFLTLAILLGGLLNSAEATSKEFESYGHGPKDLKSEWVSFTSAGLMFSPSLGIAIGLDLENRSESPIWVKLTIPAQGSRSACEQVAALASKRGTTVTCPRDTIVPDIEYPMTVEVFRDSGMTSSAERDTTQLRFHKGDLEVLGNLQAATVFPRTYKDVVYKKKLGVTTAVFGQLGPPSEGTLTVSSEGVEWKTKKQTVSVPVAQIRAVRTDHLGPRVTDAWVVVEYEEGGAAKVMALQPSAFRGAGPKAVPLIYTSLKALLERR